MKKLKQIFKRWQRFLLYVMVYLIGMFLVGLLGFGRSVDFYAYQKFYDKNQPLDEAIMLINIPRYLPGKENGGKSVSEREDSRKSYRDRTNSLLKELYSQSENGNFPKAIILDMYFTDSRLGMDSLMATLRRIRENVKVYAVFDVANIQEKGLLQREEEHSMDLYETIHDPAYRYLHTTANAVDIDTILGNKIGIVYYPCHVEMPMGGNSPGSQFAYALPLVVAADLNSKIEIPFDHDIITYDVPFGRPEEIAESTYNYLSMADEVSSGSFDKDLPPLRDKIIIIGSLSTDVVTQVQTPGPTLVAWAIDDQLHGRTNARAVMDDPVVVIGLTLFFSLLLVLFFSLFFKYVKTLQQKPIILVLLSFILTLAVLAGMFALILATDKIMLSRLILWGMVIAALLTWRYSLKFMVPAIVDGTGKYDVFISYSRAESDWVHKEIYIPLSEAKDHNGDSLEIFYDKNSIGLGEEFTSKYMWAIANSRCFLPVFSPGYYERNHCRNEVHLGVKRSVEEKIKIRGVAKSFDAVPPIYSNLNLADATANEKFIDDIITEIIKTKAEQTRN